MSWQPIETAPRSGEVVALHLSNGARINAAWIQGAGNEWWWQTAHGNRVVDGLPQYRVIGGPRLPFPTYWKPVAEPSDD